MTNEDPLRWLPPIPECASAPGVRAREAAAKLAAIANLPIGWVFEDPRRYRDDLILRATGPEGDEIEASGGTNEDAWRAMAESLAAHGEGRLIRQA